MCGIIGIVSKNQVVDRLIDGLECLEYRGYDSAGIATVNNSKIVCSKSTGKLVSLKNKLKQSPIDGYIGIGHTRWATHGGPVEINAHPHVTKNVAVVHYGIIENFAEFKDGLREKGINFKLPVGNYDEADIEDFEFKPAFMAVPLGLRVKTWRKCIWILSV